MTVRSLLVRAIVSLCGVVSAAAFDPPAKAGPAPLNLLFDGDSISANAGASSAATRLDTRVTDALGAGARLHNVAAGGRPVFECLRLRQQTHRKGGLDRISAPRIYPLSFPLC